MCRLVHTLLGLSLHVSVLLVAPRQDFRIAFRMFDLNGDGVLSSDEFERVSQYIYCTFSNLVIRRFDIQ